MNLHKSIEAVFKLLRAGHKPRKELNHEIRPWMLCTYRGLQIVSVLAYIILIIILVKHYVR